MKNKTNQWILILISLFTISSISYGEEGIPKNAVFNKINIENKSNDKLFIHLGEGMIDLGPKEKKTIKLNQIIQFQYGFKLDKRGFAQDAQVDTLKWCEAAQCDNKSVHSFRTFIPDLEDHQGHVTLTLTFEYKPKEEAINAIMTVTE